MQIFCLKIFFRTIKFWYFFFLGGGYRCWCGMKQFLLYKWCSRWVPNETGKNLFFNPVTIKGSLMFNIFFARIIPMLVHFSMHSVYDTKAFCTLILGGISKGSPSPPFSPILRSFYWACWLPFSSWTEVKSLLGPCQICGGWKTSLLCPPQNRCQVYSKSFKSIPYKWSEMVSLYNVYYSGRIR